MLNRFLTAGPVEDLYRARELLQHSVKLDPAFAKPHAALATSYSVAWINPVNDEDQKKETLQRAHESAQRAVELGSDAPAHNPGQTWRCSGANMPYAWGMELRLRPQSNYCDWRHGHCPALLGKPNEGLAAVVA